MIHARLTYSKNRSQKLPLVAQWATAVLET